MPDYLSLPLRRYFDDAAANQPTPGGGSISSMGGALAASMLSMAANFTVSNKKYADVKPQIERILARSEDIRVKLLKLVQADTEAYAYVSKAYSMPKEREDEKKARSQAIEEACKTALTPPLETAKISWELLEMADEIVDICNKNLISDVGVAAIFSMGSLEGAMLNVEINLASIKDSNYVKAVQDELNPLLDKAEAIKKKVLIKVIKALKG